MEDNQNSRPKANKVILNIQKVQHNEFFGPLSRYSNCQKLSHKPLI